jgi:signal transduction histidine kinase
MSHPLGFLLSKPAISTLSMNSSFFLGLLIIILLAGIAAGYLLFRFLEDRHTLHAPFKTRKRELASGQQTDGQQLHAIYDLISALSASLNYQRVLDNVLDLSASILGFPAGPVEGLVSAVLLFSKNQGRPTELCVGSARRFTPADMRILLPGDQGHLRYAIDEGEPVLIRKITEDPELGRIVSLRVCQAAYCIPLRAGLETYGLLLFAHPDSDFFTPYRVELLQILSHQAAIAIQNASLYNDLKQDKERILEIQEEARKKLARDLHDGPTQSVAARAMRSNFARRMFTRDVKAAGEELVKIEDLARRTTKEIRHMLFTLRPLVLESQGLIPALNAMADKMRETYSQTMIVEADPKLAEGLEVSKQAVIFFITEEAVTNARKHAQAENIWVRLKNYEEGIALLEIADDGVGFNIGEVDARYDQRGSLGMVNMRERAELVSGVLNIDSTTGKGTRVQMLIPLSEEAADQLRNRK